MESFGIKVLVDFLKSLSWLDRSWHFSMWIAPIAILLFWLYFLQTEDSLEKMQGNIAIIPLQSHTENSGEINRVDGTMLFIKQSQQNYRIPLEGEYRQNIWTSLDPMLMRLNSDKIFISSNGVLNIDMPLFDFEEPIGIMIPQAISKSENSPAIMSSAFFGISSTARGILTSVLISFSFGYGLVFSSLGWWKNKLA